MTEDTDELPCVNKMCFDSEDQAMDTAVVTEYQHSSQVKPYECRHCRLWHLASK